MARSTLDLRLDDVLTVIAVARTGSVSVAARERGVTPSQVSKASKRIARAIGHELFVRSGGALSLSEAGRERIGELRSLATIAERLVDDQRARRVCLAAPSFLADAYGAAMARGLEPHGVRLFGLDARTIQAHANMGSFDVALTPGPLAMPDAWATTHVGAIESGFFTTPAVRDSLGPSPPLGALARIPFVMPVKLSAWEVVLGEDDCPIPRADRLRGHEADTVRSALDLAAACGHIVYGPRMAARSWLESGTLVPIEVPNANTSKPLELHVHGDRVTSAMRKRLALAIESVALERALPPPKHEVRLLGRASRRHEAARRAQ